MSTNRGLGIAATHRAPADPSERDRALRRRRTTQRTPALAVTLRGACEPLFSRPVFPANPLVSGSDASLEGLVERLREDRGVVMPPPPPVRRRPSTASRRAFDLSPAAALLPALRAALAVATAEPEPAPAPAMAPAPSAIRWCVVIAAVALLLVSVALVGLAI